MPLTEQLDALNEACVDIIERIHHDAVTTRHDTWVRIVRLKSAGQDLSMIASAMGVIARLEESQAGAEEANLNASM